MTRAEIYFLTLSFLIRTGGARAQQFWLGIETVTQARSTVQLIENISIYLRSQIAESATAFDK